MSAPEVRQGPDGLVAVRRRPDSPKPWFVHFMSGRSYRATDDDVADWQPLHPAVDVSDDDVAYAEHVVRDHAEKWERLNAAITRASANLRLWPEGYDDALADELIAARDAYMPSSPGGAEPQGEADPLAHVKVGQGNPHGRRPFDAPICGAVDPDDYVCTRDPHTLAWQHIATGFHGVMAVWGGDRS